ncbi:MAG TPA: hypothetical protein VK141_05260 [Nitrosomonas sp.]|nr:hypothetical protein [Nitrosomonas sp.]
MAKTKTKIEVVGKTTEDIPVIRGMFKFFDTHGLPLDVFLYVCQEKKMIPDWISFYEDAKIAGWSHSTILNRLITAITDVYGKEFADHVKSILEKLETV